jgi:hypothetical protein
MSVLNNHKSPIREKEIYANIAGSELSPTTSPPKIVSVTLQDALQLNRELIFLI